MRRTKIVATIGPASREPETLAKLVAAGVDVFRLNFAHDEIASHAQAAAAARAEAERQGRVVAILVDLPGPKMRSGPLEQGEVTLEPGHAFVLTVGDVPGDETRVGTNLDDLPRMIAPDDEIFLADGEIVLRVTSVSDTDVVTEVVRGGILRSRKGMHIPSADRHVEAFTEDDQKALEGAIDLGADLVGLSFVRDADDLQRARDALPKRGHRPMLVAKIETRSSCENLISIVREADAVMVARGDLGIQMPLRRLPILQKEIIRTCNLAGKPVITATQMLESMTRSPLPTRAEVADVANAVLDGTDAVMLSEETAIGDDPVAAVSMMADIAESAEPMCTRDVFPDDAGIDDDRVSWAVSHAAVRAAEQMEASAILCLTRSGATARRVSAYRPLVPVIGVPRRRDPVGALALAWGVVPVIIPGEDDVDDADLALAAAEHQGLVTRGDLVVVVAGGPGRRAGQTDFMRVLRV